MGKMGMGFKFQMRVRIGWEWEWSHWNGRELGRKSVPAHLYCRGVKIPHSFDRLQVVPSLRLRSKCIS